MRKRSTKRKRAGGGRKAARKGNEISMRYRIDRVTGGRMTKRAVFEAMAHTMLTGDPLPEGMDVTWIWRNHPDQDERSDDLETAVNASRAGFINLMIRRIERDFGMSAQVREATESEIAEIEEDEDE